MRLYIEGRIRTRSWDDQNGVKRYTTEIYADNMQMLSAKQDNNDSGGGNKTYAKTEKKQAKPQVENPNPELPDDNDDLPF